LQFEFTKVSSGSVITVKTIFKIIVFVLVLVILGIAINSISSGQNVTLISSYCHDGKICQFVFSGHGSHIIQITIRSGNFEQSFNMSKIINGKHISVTITLSQSLPQGSILSFNMGLSQKQSITGNAYMN